VCHVVRLDGGAERRCVKAFQRPLRPHEDRGCDIAGSRRHGTSVTREEIRPSCDSPNSNLDRERWRTCSRVVSAALWGTGGSARVQKHKDRVRIVKLSAYVSPWPRQENRCHYVFPIRLTVGAGNFECRIRPLGRASPRSRSIRRLHNAC